ncbi:Clavesin-1 [Armadillidium nasatum]|uniref:Clavesin-1 n=1 Tax=Armadillidium nasatum TaxID=96803 RepID=A0A5N5T6F5_9CRUS|nr:Clavesin-1 [Armadillidium nasatum]
MGKYWEGNQINVIVSNFLLRFLRMKKFRVGDAQQILERYLRMRMDHPSWFRNLDFRDPRMEDLIDRGYFFALPERDDAGRRVFFSVAGCLDATRDTSSDMMKAVQIGLESLIEDEENQVRGFCYILDEKNVGFSVVTLWTPSEVSKAFHCSEKNIPMRHKEIHFVNLPISLYAVFEVAKTMLSDKIRKRFQVHNNVEQLAKSVPKRILPKEYGGTTPLKDIIVQYKKELEDVRGKILSLDEMEWSKPVKLKKLDKFSVNKLQRSFKMIEID